MFLDEESVRRIKKQYPVGTRVMVDFMGDDPHPIAPGTKGIAICLDALKSGSIRRA